MGTYVERSINLLWSARYAHISTTIITMGSQFYLFVMPTTFFAVSCVLCLLRPKLPATVISFRPVKLWAHHGEGSLINYVPSGQGLHSTLKDSIFENRNKES